MIDKNLDIQINKFNFFKLNKMLIEITGVTKSFLVRKDNISQSVNILREKLKFMYGM